MNTLDEIKQEFGEQMVEICEELFDVLYDTIDEIVNHGGTDEDVNEIMAMYMNIIKFKMNECIQKRYE